MKVLLLGATGLIGSAILPQLHHHGHTVLALARSDDAKRQLVSNGVDVLRGDLRNPRKWSNAIQQVDAVIHVAATFTDDMGDIDREVIKALITAGDNIHQAIRFIYTGGTWLYGDTGGVIATEKTAFKPISSFAWMLENSALLIQAPCFITNIIHPAMVYVQDGGAFSNLMPKDGRVEIWGAPEVRWPLVHADDLAVAYRLVLESDARGESYNVCTEQGLRQEDIANVISKRFDLQTNPLVRSRESLVAERGQWAEGPTFDQCLSSEKIRMSLGWKPMHTNALSALT